MQVDLLSVALVSVTMAGEDRIELEVTAQISAITPEMADDYQGGWNASLSNLERFLARP